MHDMALFFIGPFEGCRPELFQTSIDLQLVCPVMDYITPGGTRLCLGRGCAAWTSGP